MQTIFRPDLPGSDVQEATDLHLEAGLLEELARDALDDGLAELDAATGTGPQRAYPASLVS